MKKVLVAVAAVMLSMSAHALDGQFTLGNKSGTALDKPVKFEGGAKDGTKVDAGYAMQLFLVSGGSETAVGSAITFRSGAAAGYIVSTGMTLANYGAVSGTETFRIKAYDVGTSYATATTYHGISPDFTAAVNVAPTPPVLTANFPSFTLTPVPEPSTIALAALGGAALLLRRRK